MSDTAKDRHIDTIAAYLLDGSQLMALRYYAENRVSRATLEEAKAKAARLKKFFDNRNGNKLGEP